MEYGIFPFETPELVLDTIGLYYRYLTFNNPTAVAFLGQGDTFPAVGRVIASYDTQGTYSVKGLIACHSNYVLSTPAPPVSIDCYGVLVFPPGTYYVNPVNPLLGAESSINFTMKAESATGNEESFLDIHLGFRPDGSAIGLVRFDFEVPGRLSVAFLADETRADQYIREHRAFQFVQVAVGLHTGQAPSFYKNVPPTVSDRLTQSVIGISGAGNIPILMGQSFSVDTPNRIAFFFHSPSFVKPTYLYQITWRGRIV